VSQRTVLAARQGSRIASSIPSRSFATASARNRSIIQVPLPFQAPESVRSVESGARRPAPAAPSNRVCKDGSVSSLSVCLSLTSAVVGPNCFVCKESPFILSLCRGFMPSLDRLHDLRRDLRRRIDFSVDRFRSGAPANLRHLSLLGWQYHHDDLVRAQLFAQGPPGGLHAAI
jgi:hypothetical protein